MSTDSRILDLGAAVALIPALIMVLLYTVGWSYAYHWYDSLRVGVDRPGYPLRGSRHARHVGVVALVWLVLPVTILLTGALIFYTRISCILIAMLPAWILLIFVLAYLLGRNTAQDGYLSGKERGFNHFPLVRVWTIPNPGDTPTRLQTVRQDLAAGSYRRLLQTDQLLCLIHPNQEGGRIPTLQIPRNRVRALRRIPTNPGR